ELFFDLAEGGGERLALVVIHRVSSGWAVNGRHDARVESHRLRSRGPGRADATADIRRLDVAVSHTRQAGLAVCIASFRQGFPQAFERRCHGLSAHRLAIPRKMEHPRVRIATTALPADPHRADRLVGHAAGGPGN